MKSLLIGLTILGASTALAQQEPRPFEPTAAHEAWRSACAGDLELDPITPAVEGGWTRTRTRAGEVVALEVSVSLEGLTITRCEFKGEREAALYHRARSKWEPEGQPTVAQVRGRQLVRLAGRRASAEASFLARALAAAWGGEAQPDAGPSLELSLSSPWKDDGAGVSGVDRVAFTRLEGVAHSGSYHGDVTSAVSRARQGESEGVRFLDIPLRNHLLQDGGPDSRLEFRLGADDVALHADTRDEASARLRWKSLKALLAALEDPGFAPATETVGPPGEQSDSPPSGPAIDGALGD